jgi:hypothetical protein
VQRRETATPASTPASTTSPDATPVVQDAPIVQTKADEELVLLPTRMGALRFGMSEQDAKATGLLGELVEDVEDGCRTYEAGPSSDRTGFVRIGRGDEGLFSITAPRTVPTPKGIRANLPVTRNDVQAAYPDVQEYRAGPANDQYRFRFDGASEGNGGEPRLASVVVEGYSVCSGNS